MDNKTEPQPPASEPVKAAAKKEVKKNLPGWHPDTTRIDHGNIARKVQ